MEHAHLSSFYGMFVLTALSLRSFFFRERADLEALYQNTQAIAEALARHVFELKENAGVDRFFDDLKVREKAIFLHFPGFRLSLILFRWNART